MAGLLDMCCPKKPKKSLDYIVKWVEDTDKTIKDLDTWMSSIKDEDLKPIFDEYAEEYDWSQVPAFDTKVDKVPGAPYGSLAFFNGTGNITSSFYSTKQLVDISISSGEVSSRTLKVNLPSPDTAVYGSISVVEHNNESVDIVLSTGLKGAATPVLNTTITHDNIGNLDRALQDPDTEPTADSDKLITSKAVYDALQAKADSVHTHSGIEEVIENTQSAKLYADNQTQGEPAIIIELTDNNTPGSSVTKYANINIESIDNLNRALQDPDITPINGSNELVTSGGVYTAISKKSDKEFCDKVYSRLMELEKNSSVEYGVTATYVYREAGSNRPELKIDGTDIIYDYDSASNEIMGLYNVPYLYGLVFVGDVLVIKDLTTGTSIGIATVEGLSSAPNRIALSGLPLPDTSSYNDKSIEIAITHGNY